MTARTRPLMTVLAALATLSTLLPVRDLFLSTAWLLEATAAVVIVAVVGVLGRALVPARLLVVALQVLAGAGFVLVRFAGAPARPQPDAALPQQLVYLGELLDAAVKTVTTYKAPAPHHEGITFMMVLLALAVAIATDAFAVTWNAPAAAGLPLLTSYLVTAANGSEPLGMASFLPPVALWLCMVWLGSGTLMRRWATASGSVDDGPTGGRSLASSLVTAGLVAAVAIAGSVSTAAVVPHFSPRYIAEGFGRAGSDGSGTVGFNDTLDLTRSLQDTNTDPVLDYTSTRPSATPLRVLATSYYSRGEWMVAGLDEAEPFEIPLPGTGVRREYQLEVRNNQLRAPRLATMYAATHAEVDGSGNTVTIDPVTRDIRVSESVDSYRVDFVDTVPTPAQIRAASSGGGPPAAPDVRPDDLQLPPGSELALFEWAQQVVGTGADDPLEIATRIQDHLRDTTQYTYTLDVQDSTQLGDDADAVLAFRQTRRGYCVQFATAMIMLARASGIPARMVIGFLPGTPQNGRMVVRQSDAHAWPELYFSGVGWLRFEPTPGQRSGTPPAYAVDAPAAASTSARPTREDLERPTRSLETGGTAPTTAPESSSGPTLLDRLAGALTLGNLLSVLGLLAALMVVFLMPITAWFIDRRRRRRAATQQQLAEVEWQRLTEQLDDLGLPPPPGGTLRHTRAHYIGHGHLDEPAQEALARVTRTLEDNRYARPDSTTRRDRRSPAEDVHGIVSFVRRTRSRGTRIRAFLLPGRAVRWWARRLGR